MIASAEFDFAPLTRLGLTMRKQAPLAALTTMKVGGPAEYLVAVTTTDQLLKTVRWARAVGLPYFILGGGSNILISDAGMAGLVIHNRCRTVRIDEPPCCVYPLDERPYLFAESGAPTAGAARTSVKAGLTGFEWAISVPGVIGGAVVGNAGAHGGEVKDTLEYAWVIDAAGEVVEMSRGDFDYGYRDSALKRLRPLQAAFKTVVLSANFRLRRDEPQAIRERAEGFLQHRRRTQPTAPSLGSTFVNPPGDYAGRLIEAAGLKGACVGGVEVSRLHANFLINPGGVGGATASDVMRLIDHVVATVLHRMGVELELEVQLAGEWAIPNS